MGTIKGRNYAEADIIVRTELSYARQSLNTIRDLLFDRKQLSAQKKELDQIESEVNDLLKYLNKAMDHTREVRSNEFFIDFKVMRNNNLLLMDGAF